MNPIGLKKTIRSLPALLLLCLLTPAAVAGTIFKCTVDGQVKYQDTPCAAGAKVIERPSGDASSTPVKRLALPDLLSEKNAAEKRYRELEEGYRKDVEQTNRQRIDNNTDPGFYYRESARLEAQWVESIQIARRRRDELVAELSLRCPRGAYGEGSNIACHK